MSAPAIIQPDFIRIFIQKSQKYLMPGMQLDDYGVLNQTNGKRGFYTATRSVGVGQADRFAASYAEGFISGGGGTAGSVAYIY